MEESSSSHVVELSNIYQLLACSQMQSHLEPIQHQLSPVFQATSTTTNYSNQSLQISFLLESLIPSYNYLFLEFKGSANKVSAISLQQFQCLMSLLLLCPLINLLSPILTQQQLSINSTSTLHMPDQTVLMLFYSLAKSFVFFQH